MMKKIITLIMCIICCCSYAFVYESGSGRYLEEGYGSSGFGSGSGSEHDGPDYPTGTERIVYFLDPNDDSDILYEEKHSDGFTIDLSLPKYQAVASPKTPTHYHYSGWTNTSLEDVTTVTLNGSDITLYVKWSKNRTNIFFIDDSGTTKQTYEYNDVVVAPTPATRIGYTANWDNNLPAVVADTNNRDFDSIYVNAVYTINTWALYKVIGGVTTKVSDIAYNTVIASSTLPDPSVTGYTFVGWQNFPSNGKMPNNDLTVTANLSVNHHNVTWIYQDADGNSHTLLPEEGTEYSSANVAYNTSLIQPTISLPSGWVMNWTYGGQPISGMTMPDSDITITGVAEQPDYIVYINESTTPPTVTYGGANAAYQPVHLENNQIDMGGWSAFINQMFTPVMLKNDGTEAYELDRSNLGKKLDGTPSDITNASFAGNAMVRIKKIYTYFRKSENTLVLAFSFTKKNSNYHAYGFIGNDGLERDNVYVGIYEASIPDTSSNKLRSISGSAIKYGSTSYYNQHFGTAAQNNGSGYDIVPMLLYKTIKALGVLVTRNITAYSFYSNINKTNYGSLEVNSGSMGNVTTNGFIFPTENKFNEMFFWMEGLITNGSEFVSGMRFSTTTTDDNYKYPLFAVRSLSDDYHQSDVAYCNVGFMASVGVLDGIEVNSDGILIPSLSSSRTSNNSGKYRWTSAGANFYNQLSSARYPTTGFTPAYYNSGGHYEEGVTGFFNENSSTSSHNNGAVQINSTARLYYISYNYNYEPPLMMSAPLRQRANAPEVIEEPINATDTEDIASESEEL